MTEPVVEVPSFPRNGTQKPRKGWGKPIQPKTSLKRSKAFFTGSTKKHRSDKLKELQALKREWLIPTTNNYKLRYTGLRGVYWYWLSRDVRKSEWEKYGHCITCLGTIEDWTKEDCGHILSSNYCGEYLRLNRINLTIQHKKCNNPRFCPQAGVANAINIDKRHGVGTMAKLYELRKKEAKAPTQAQYRELIRALPSYQEAYNKALLASEKLSTEGS